MVSKEIDPSTGRLLKKLHSSGQLSTTQQTKLAGLLHWDKKTSLFKDYPDNDAFWDGLFAFVDVMQYRDSVYPQPDRGSLEQMRLAVLPLLAEKKQWNTQFIERGNDPRILVMLMLRSLWCRYQVPGDCFALGTASIFEQWTNEILEPSDSIAVLEEKIGKTLFGVPWWTLYNPEESDTAALYVLLREDCPPVLNKWLTKPNNVSIVLTDDIVFVQKY